MREIYRFGIPLTAEIVHTIQLLSFGGAAIFVCVYLAHVLSGLRQGNSVNPLKYVFILCNYSVLYYISWHTASILIYSVANVIMHGTQYIVIVHSYMQRKIALTDRAGRFAVAIAKPGHVVGFVAMLALYALLYQLMRGRPLDEFGFGVISFMRAYQDLPELGLKTMSSKTGSELFLATIVNVPGMLHLYYDSFIWKVREKQSQAGL